MDFSPLHKFKLRSEDESGFEERHLGEVLVEILELGGCIQLVHQVGWFPRLRFPRFQQASPRIQDRMGFPEILGENHLIRDRFSRGSWVLLRRFSNL